eukprot:122868-Pelagomonas_calceolata.AAC.3
MGSSLLRPLPNQPSKHDVKKVKVKIYAGHNQLAARKDATINRHVPSDNRQIELFLPSDEEASNQAP